MTIPTEPAPNPPPPRRASIDAYRGFVMLLMMAEVLELSHVARAVPGNPFWAFLAQQQSHVEWTGCVLHDLIQPSFSFLVGVALPFSLASRAGRGESFGRTIAHALWRGLVLVLLGVFLRSVGRPQTHWTFEDTLSQIGLGFPLLCVLGRRSLKVQWAAVAALLFGVWLCFALRPLTLPGPDQGVEAGWGHLLPGFLAHWNKNANPAFDFDLWFLNRFAREEPWRFNGGGYATLSFVPTLATMLLGSIAGHVLRSDLPEREKIVRFVAFGVAGIAVGALLEVAGVCPVVKRIWTPAWVLFSGGWCALLLAGFVAWADRPTSERATFFLRVIGANSIAAYVGSHLMGDLVGGALDRHLGPEVLEIIGAPFAPLVRGVLMLAVYWLLLGWMWRRKLFLRV